MLTPALAAAGRAPSAAYDGKSLPALPDGNGGLAGLSPKQVETIRRARETVKRMASSLYESHWTRIRAVSALLRVHEALNDWGRKGQLAWYFERLRDEPHESVRRPLLRNAIWSAKARQYHLGGVWAFWRKIDEMAKTQPWLGSTEIQRMRSDFDTISLHLNELPSPVPTQIEPYVLETPKFNLEGSLRPYRKR